jgi:hypothetical protein
MTRYLHSAAFLSEFSVRSALLQLSPLWTQSELQINETNDIESLTFPVSFAIGDSEGIEDSESFTDSRMINSAGFFLSPSFTDVDSLSTT